MTDKHLVQSADRLTVGSDELAFRVTSEQTDGALLAIDVFMPAGGGPPMLDRHVPAEIYRVLSGELTLYLEDAGGQLARVRAAAGAVVAIPGGRQHSVRNESPAEARAYVVFAPGGEIEQFMRAAGAADPEDVAALAELHGIVMTQPVPMAA
jgi:oxalate decarboxylase/phosphoglucose isomerase-like protein (cupin superfamily)